MKGRLSALGFGLRRLEIGLESSAKAQLGFSDQIFE